MFYGKVNVDGVEIDRFTDVVGVPVLFKKTNENAIMPSKAHDDDFCYDCYAVSEEEIAPNVWTVATFPVQFISANPSCRNLWTHVKAVDTAAISVLI